MSGYLTPQAKVYVAGHQGLVGSAIVRALNRNGFHKIVTRSLAELDLRKSENVNHFFTTERPDLVFLAAARVGGIKANSTYPADFIYDNLMIASNVINAAFVHKVKKLLYLGSSCIYPRECPQPIKEEYLMTGPLEWTNEPYAIAKIAGINLCRSYNRQHGTHFISVMPTNLYGPGDNFNLETAHVIPALMAKFHQAIVEQHDQVVIWGTGTPRREFLYVDDLAQALVFLMHRYDDSQHINVGVGHDVTIGELAHVMQRITGFKGALVFDETKPDGTPRKLLNVDRINALGWRATISLEEGLKKTYAWYVEHAAERNKKVSYQEKAV